MFMSVRTATVRSTSFAHLAGARSEAAQHVTFPAAHWVKGGGVALKLRQLERHACQIGHREVRLQPDRLCG